MTTASIADARAPLITGAATTPFGRHEGSDAIGLMARAAGAAIAEAGLEPGHIDGVLCGYATTLPHIMLATLFCERFGLRPSYAHGMSLGGGTGGAMLMLAGELVRAGRCRNVLVVAGENRATGVSRDSTIQTLAQVGDPDFEVPNGTTIPAYYALLASRWLHETGCTEADLAEFAVLMRARAAEHPDAHLRTPITVDEVLASKPIATPLKLLDCCPISDGAAALVVSAHALPNAPRVAMLGAGQAHLHQHISAIADTANYGARDAAQAALAQAGLAVADIDYLAIYDSFSVTLAILLEEIGFAPRGGAAQRVRERVFDPGGPLPLNTHGGLMSFGHSGAAGGMCHAVEAVTQLAGRAGVRQVAPRHHAFFHADGGVLSSHVSIVMGREG
ncbi:MAG: thiolase family protein [Burkholderiaceae bacterium]|nr:thiolase family protein [Burkholderiaceae bacterium]